MKLRCPCCGAEMSLAVLIDNEAARQMLWDLVKYGDSFMGGLIRYLGLFRPAKSSLTFSRMQTLMSELFPLINEQQITRNGQTFNAPVDAWISAFNTVLNARDSGQLKTPLKSHGYLYEVIAGLDSKPTTSVEVVNPKTQRSNVSHALSGLAKLEAMKHG